MFFILTFPNKVHYETKKKEVQSVPVIEFYNLFPPREWGSGVHHGAKWKNSVCVWPWQSPALRQIKAKIWTLRKKCYYYSVAEALVRNDQLFIRQHTLHLYSTSQYLNHFIYICISSHLVPTTSCRPGWGQANQYCYLTETQWGSK